MSFLQINIVNGAPMLVSPNLNHSIACRRHHRCCLPPNRREDSNAALRVQPSSYAQGCDLLSKEFSGYEKLLAAYRLPGDLAVIRASNAGTNSTNSTNSTTTA